ncbi:class I SAM-dependent methyltransferase [Persicobacter psychrovividus]|uniref:Methyltransferase type 11 domain-containing protein n=1 Tax=Persicobacter psychrovividus TaxID=387638 RepID=A0ABM7VBD3_9BACT|nr:hypothetical protein PEPS_04940 [Persicobacter psychrovividus]
MSVYTTEIASDQIPSDNPIHQRLLKAYYAAQPFVSGRLLEVGCGEGRGVSLLAPKSESYTAIDKIHEVVEKLQAQHPEVDFRQAMVPPFEGIADESFDTVVSFQVIEHIEDDALFLKEIHRVLKKGGKAIISTPNIIKTLSRNPWHIREYTAEELRLLANRYFDQIDTLGIGGNEKVWEYYHRNKKSVQAVMKYDFLNLQYRLPAALLKIPYDIMNRRNRNKLKDVSDDLVKSISHQDYLLVKQPEEALDLFYVLTK